MGDRLSEKVRPHGPDRWREMNYGRGAEDDDKVRITAKAIFLSDAGASPLCVALSGFSSSPCAAAWRSSLLLSSGVWLLAGLRGHFLRYFDSRL